MTSSSKDFQGQSSTLTKVRVRHLRKQNPANLGTFLRFFWILFPRMTLGDIPIFGFCFLDFAIGVKRRHWSEWLTFVKKSYFLTFEFLIGIVWLHWNTIWTNPKTTWITFYFYDSSFIKLLNLSNSNTVTVWVILYDSILTHFQFLTMQI